jgi:Caspase domain
MSGNRYALIVAGQRYDDPKLRQLRAPARDAEALADVLADPAVGEFHVDVCLDESEAQVRRKLVAFFRDRGRDDLLLLHFSCHGVKDDDGNLYFATPDTELDALDATAVSAEFVERQIGRSRSRRIVLLLDCCYSGAFARGARARASEGVDLRERFEGRGRAIITASSAMEYAFEGDELSGAGSPSVFTQTLVEGITSGAADRDSDGAITVDELYDYIYEQVRERTPKQTPRKWSDVEGQLIIAHNPNPVVRAAELPAELRTAVDSPFAGVREGAARELAQLLEGSNPGLAEAARLALESLRGDDSRRVSELAVALLERREVVAPPPPPQRPESPPPSPPPRPARSLEPPRQSSAEPPLGTPARAVADASTLAALAVAAGALIYLAGVASFFDQPAGASVFFGQAGNLQSSWAARWPLLEPIMLSLALVAAAAALALARNRRACAAGLAAGLAAAATADGVRYALLPGSSAWTGGDWIGWIPVIAGACLALVAAVFALTRCEWAPTASPVPRRRRTFTSWRGLRVRVFLRRRRPLVAIGVGALLIFVEPFNRPEVRSIDSFGDWAPQAVVPLATAVVLAAVAVALYRWPLAAEAGAAAVAGIAAPAALSFLGLIRTPTLIGFDSSRGLLGRGLALAGAGVASAAGWRLARSPHRGPARPFVVNAAGAAVVLGAVLCLYAFVERHGTALAPLRSSSGRVDRALWPFLDIVGVPTLILVAVLAGAIDARLREIAAGAIVAAGTVSAVAYASAGFGQGPGDHRIGLPLAGMVVSSVAAAVVLGALGGERAESPPRIDDGRRRLAFAAGRLGAVCVLAAVALRVASVIQDVGWYYWSGRGWSELQVPLVVQPLAIALAAVVARRVLTKRRPRMPAAWEGAFVAIGLCAVLFFVPLALGPRGYAFGGLGLVGALVGLCGSVLLAVSALAILEQGERSPEELPQAVPAV